MVLALALVTSFGLLVILSAACTRTTKCIGMEGSQRIDRPRVNVHHLCSVGGRIGDGMHGRM